MASFHLGPWEGPKVVQLTNTSTSLLNPTAASDFENFAATTIQRYYKGYKCRTEYRNTVAAIKAATDNQLATYEAWERLNTAARRIQTAWRNYRDKRIFRYYRDLIQFRERGDPKEMLKGINPKECGLADAAAGLHVRFRLGGIKFPPLIYYKIYTHRPVTDICAFCPRDYANEVSVPTAMLHNRARKEATTANVAAAAGSTGGSGGRKASGGAGGGPQGGTSASSQSQGRGWYERWENNGWRPVHCSVLEGEEDPVAAASRSKRIPAFHHNPAVRREERARRQKQRKREWLMKMYRDGMLGGDQAAAQMQALTESSSGAVEGHVASDGLDDLAALDEVADQLAEWSAALDFDAYVDSWTQLATSMGSEAYVPELEAPYLEQLNNNNPVLGLTQAFQNSGVPMAPFKGGATATCSVLSTTPLRM